MNNILILSAGRRVELVNEFANDIKSRKLRAMLFATDMNPSLSAACQVVDKAFEVPPIYDPMYLSVLKSICYKNNIKLVIPTIDTELELLSESRDSFEDEKINVVISDIGLVRSCRDKRKTPIIFKELGIDTPEIYSQENIKFPCFVKPYDGSSSVGARLLMDSSALTDDVLSDRNLIIMEYIGSDYQECTVDTYYDRLGKLCSLVPRMRINVRSGEVNKSVTRRNYIYEQLVDKLKRVKGARGCITFQFFVNDELERLIGLEINPRFGGGYPLSYNAGATYPGWLVDEYMHNKKITYNDEWEDDLMMLRYDAHVLVHNFD